LSMKEKWALGRAHETSPKNKTEKEIAHET
jgi:hypothetical protein